MFSRAELSARLERVEHAVGSVALVCGLKVGGVAVSFTDQEGERRCGGPRGGGRVGEEMTVNLRGVKGVSRA